MAGEKSFLEKAEEIATNIINKSPVALVGNAVHNAHASGADKTALNKIEEAASDLIKHVADSTLVAKVAHATDSILHKPLETPAVPKGDPKLMK